MKRNRFVVILVAMAMSMLLVQGALAADEELGELVASIEVDRSAVVDDLVNSLATDDATAEQLRATLEALSVSKLAEIYANAATLDDVQAMLSEDILALGDLDKDYVYTPVSPCRIIDTRRAGGEFAPGERREFRVYGNTAAQGGAVCNSPRGEPRGVHIYIVAVPVAGQGNFGAFPANIAPPNAAILNYRTGVQNIGNAATIKTFFGLGNDIEFINRFGRADLVVDVLGYYHDSRPGLAGFESSQRSERSSALLARCDVAGGSANWTTLATVTLSTPSSRGIIWVHANGISRHGNDKWGRVCIASGNSGCTSWAPILDQSSVEVAEGDWDRETRWVVSDTFSATGGNQTFRLKGCKQDNLAFVDLLWDDFVGLYLPNRY